MSDSYDTEKVHRDMQRLWEQIVRQTPAQQRRRRVTPRELPALPARTYSEQTVVRATGYTVRRAVHALCPKVRL